MTQQRQECRKTDSGITFLALKEANNDKLHTQKLHATNAQHIVPMFVQQWLKFGHTFYCGA